jgi:biopolymer transport protein TolR
LSTFTWPVRIYYEDTDAGGVVFYANYLKFMERARTEWLRAIGHEQDRLARARGILFAVRRVAIDYLAPARFNDCLSVTSRLVRAGGASLEFDQQVMRDRRPCCCRGSRQDRLHLHADTCARRACRRSLVRVVAFRERSSGDPVMTSDLSLFNLILQASLVVQLVLLVLVIASVTSWTMILDRGRVLSSARKSANAFEERFWSGGDLSALYKDLSENRKGDHGLPSIFRAGFKEYVRLRKIEGNDLMAVLQGSERSMRVALSREMDRSGDQPDLPGDGRLHQSLHRPLRHRLGHHACLPCAGERRAGDPGAGRARHLGGAGRHRHRSLRGHPRRHRLQQVHLSGRASQQPLRGVHGRVLDPACSAKAATERSRNPPMLKRTRSRQRRRPMAEINVVPYIDVMLVLLVIFMVTAPLITQGVKVALPQETAGGIPSPTTESLIITVDEFGDYYIDIGDEKNAPASEQILFDRIRVVLEYTPGTPILVRADHRVDYGRVVRAMVVAQAAGAPEVGLVTVPPERRER